VKLKIHNKRKEGKTRTVVDDDVAVAAAVKHAALRLPGAGSDVDGHRADVHRLDHGVVIVVLRGRSQTRGAM
jgi:hypothetical protein